MNEHISRLAEEATYAMEFTENDLLLETVNNDITYHVPAEFIKKFAELIVRECANEILKWDSEPFPYDPKFGASLIKQHFGVEE